MAKLKSYIHRWYWASRPFSLTASIVPVLLGSSLAFSDGKWDMLSFSLIMMGSILVQIGTNLVDEYADDARAEREEKLIAPYKVIALGLLSHQSVRAGAICCFGLATCIGIYLTFKVGWPILAIGLVSLLVAYCYSAGPIPLGSLALGEIVVFIFMGPIMVGGTYYVYTESFSIETFAMSIPIACMVTAILVANDLRDVEEDRNAGKRTIVTIMGRKFGRIIWMALIMTGYSVVLFQSVFSSHVDNIYHSTLFLLPLLAFPRALKAFRMVYSREDRHSLSIGMQQTAGLHLWFGLLLSLSVVGTTVL